MNYGALSTEKLKKELKQQKAWLRWAETANAAPDLWKLEIKEKIAGIEAELSLRKKEPVWI